MWTGVKSSTENRILYALKTRSNFVYNVYNRAFQLRGNFVTLTHIGVNLLGTREAYCPLRKKNVKSQCALDIWHKPKFFLKKLC